MNLRILRCLFVPAAILALCAVVGADVDDELKDLKERFQKRYATLAALKDSGRIGEIFDGYCGVVKPEYAGEKASTAPDSPTVGEFAETENKDRRRLYALLAERNELTPELFAERNGKRNFENAGPEHFLKPKGKDWTKKKDLSAE